MTEKKLRDLAQAAGFSIKKGFTYSESNGVHTGESGYEVVNERTHEPVTFNAYGEDNIHYGYSLENVEDFLRNVYEQAEIPFPEDSEEITELENHLKKHYVDADAARKIAESAVALANVKGEDDEQDKSIFVSERSVIARCNEVADRVKVLYKSDEEDVVLGKLKAIDIILDASDMDEEVLDENGYPVFTDYLGDLLFVISEKAKQEKEMQTERRMKLEPIEQGDSGQVAPLKKNFGKLEEYVKEFKSAKLKCFTDLSIATAGEIYGNNDEELGDFVNEFENLLNTINNIFVKMAKEINELSKRIEELEHKQEEAD